MSNQTMVPATCNVAIRVRPANPPKFTVRAFLQSLGLSGLWSGRWSGLSSGLSSGKQSAWARYWQSRTDRRAFQAMLVLNDARLADIGVTREEVLWANDLPLSQNAALRLREAGHARRRSR